jgi:hypothetical protein
MTIEKPGFGDAGSAWKSPRLSHQEYHLSSTRPGSYALESSDIGPRIVPDSAADSIGFRMKNPLRP